MEDYQRRSVAILQDAQQHAHAAQSAPASARSYVPPAGATDDEVRTWQTDHQAFLDAQSGVSGAASDLRALEEERDDEARPIAKAIRHGADDDVKDGWWDNFCDFMDRYAGVFDAIGKICGAIGLVLMVVALFVPGLNGLVIAVTLIGLGAHAALASTGNGSWTDVGLDVLALATLGIGRFAGAAVKAGQGATRAAGAAREGAEAARVVRLTSSAERAALGTRMSRGSQTARQARAEHARVTAQMNRQMAQASDALSDAYRAVPIAKAPVVQRIANGFDPELAALRGDMARVVTDFPGAARVTQAAQEARTAVRVATTNAWVGVAGGGFGVYSDYLPVPGYDRLKDWADNRPVNGTAW
ncbi:hypothetical protein GCM10025868_16460 [Angustibacter aerolatus]|uniref:Uncharacterized protein n=1 Tax=Angustibacter aerolatus TaxID=1162965 RepID=A0ABQ6JDY2_9ACTN|nr:hypothetical protein [Angustibacter aerolatus]GMA86396.1 hypothetical protein GCM10025868_16460 [Angustibacter aerolatus]